jgi:hypothetical protein
MHNDSMTKLEKLEWILWYLKQTLDGSIMEEDTTKIAISFIESIRDCYIQDYK